MPPQLYRNAEHPGLGLLQVVEATPIEGDLRLFLPSNFRPRITGSQAMNIDYFGLTKKRSGLYDVVVQDERGLQFTMKDAFWDSFVPVSHENSGTPKRMPVDEYLRFVDKAVSASTKEYCGLLQEVFKEGGILKAVRFDVDVSVERLANFYIFR